MPKQTYSNYYREYFKTEKGHAALYASKARYHARLHEAFPGMAINKAAKLYKMQRDALNV